MRNGLLFQVCLAWVTVGVLFGAVVVLVIALSRGACA